MQSLVFSLPIISGAILMIAMSSAVIKQMNASRAWWGTMCLIIVFGGIVGFRLSFLEFDASPKVRCVGVPLPLGFLVLEGDQWTGFVIPKPVQFFNLLANTLAPVLVALILFTLLLWIVHWSGRRESESRRSNDFQ